MFDNKTKSIVDAVSKVLGLQEKVSVKKEYDDKDESEHGVYHNGKKIGYVVHNKKDKVHTAYHSPQGEDGDEDYGQIDDFHSHQHAVNQIKHSAGVNEEIDPKKRTKDTLKGADEPTKQKDDVGPGSDGKSTKVKYRPGPLATEGFKDKLFNSLKEEKLDEASEDMLARYMKSRGYNPETTTKDKKIAITKSNEFKKWLNDHQFEETQYESGDYSEEQLDEMINEVLSKDATAGDWIHDFVHSKNPKFEGKSKKKRQQMALAAYYAHQREEVETQVVAEDLDDIEDTRQLRNAIALAKSQKAIRQAKDGKDAKYYADGTKVTPAEVARRAAERKAKKQGVAEGSDYQSYLDKYSNSKSKKPLMTKTEFHTLQRKKEDDKKYKRVNGVIVGRKGVAEAKHTETDNVPFVEPYQKTQPDVQDKGTGGVHTPMSRAKHLARISLKKVKSDVGVKEETDLEEGAFSSGHLRLTPQGQKKFDDLRKSMKSTSTIRDKDEKGTYTSVRVKPAGETEYKEISRKYDKE